MNSEPAGVAIVGGGMMGVTLAYFLSRRGITVELFEASPLLGGLAGSVALEDGTSVDRYYHTILSSDGHLRQLCTELGVADQLRFHKTRMGFYHNDAIYSMDGIVDFLRFPPLGLIDRLRLGMTVLYAQFVRDWHDLEAISVQDWLTRLSGRRTYENVWRPLLKAKFDGSFADAPATYIWARLVRMKSTRKGAGQQEEAGHLIGGYTTLLKAMTGEIEAAGGKVHLSCPVDEIVIERGRACGLRVEGQTVPFGTIVATMPVPTFRQLIPGASHDYDSFLSATEYLGLICPLLVLSRPLSGFWTLNITDDRIPFTGIIETTAYINPQYVGGHYLVYLPKYTAPGSTWQQMSDAEIKETWLRYLSSMFPDFNRKDVRYFLVHREDHVEPLHRLKSSHQIPPVKTPVEGLYLATTAQIYPALTNAESISRHAHQVAETIAMISRPCETTHTRA